MDNLLGKVVDRVRRLDPANARSWFDDLRLVRLSGGLLVIGCQDQDQIQYLVDRCRHSFILAAQQITGHLVSVEFEQISPDRSSQRPDASGLRLHPDYTFENFVVGPSNRLAHAGAVAVSNNIGLVYNPLFLYGASGLGKTHLLQAICHKIRSQDRNVRILLLSCEQFVNQFIKAIQDGDIGQFQTSIRATDVLVVDDIQFLADSEQSQEEFFHTFNALYNDGRQIVLSADRPPGEIPSLESRLISRFNWGLVARIDPPTFETRVAILQRKAQLRGLTLQEDVSHYIARYVQANIRELEGALTTIYALSMAEQGPITIELARRAIECQIGLASKTISIQDIVDVVSRHFDISPKDLNGKRRNRSIAVPRQICMYLARCLTKLSLEEIGMHLGSRDHTTVMHACAKVGQIAKEDPKFKTLLDELIRQINSL